MAIGPTKITETLGTLRKVARHYNSSYLSVTARFLKLYCFDRFTRVEILALGIADPRMPSEQLAKLASRKRNHRLQSEINPVHYAFVTEDKAIFHHFCVGAGLRTPQLYAIVDPSSIWTPEGKWLGRSDDWDRFFRDDLPNSFVVKPTTGINRESVYVLSRESESFREVSGTIYSGQELLRAIREDPVYDRFIVQERIETHQSLSELSGTEVLQTMRVITGVDDSGEPAILLAFQKLIGNSNKADNFGIGRRGNLIAELSLDDGAILQAVTRDESGFDVKAVESHPTSGRRLIGFQIPHWQELRQMVIDAARKVMPIRTIGWDVVVTSEGPLVIEANIYWSPDHANAVRRTDRFLEYHSRVKRKTRLGRSF